jgi:predicted transposase/invertase (TIGR01784 family)
LAIDNICKYLAEQYPAEFASWLLSTEITDIQVLKTELSVEPIRADSLTLLQSANQILQIEFQTLPTSDPPLPFRMLKYWVRLYNEYSSPIEQVVIFLKRSNSPSVFTDTFSERNTTHRYRVIRLWEQDPEALLANSALLPLATLAQTNSPNSLLEEIASRVAMIEEPDQRQEVTACVEVLAGLRFEKELIRQLFREENMQESVIYQDILQKGLQQGLKQGLQQGLQQGELAVIMRLLNHRFGTVHPDLQQRLQRLSIPQLENLGEAILDFAQPNDLTIWLEEQSF